MEKVSLINIKISRFNGKVEDYLEIELIRDSETIRRSQITRTLFESKISRNFDRFKSCK